MKRKSILGLLVLSSLLLLAAGCSKSEAVTEEVAAPAKSETAAPAATVSAPDTATYADGIYFAMGDSFSSGWKDTATIVVQDGKIVSADWNGVNVNGGADKKTYVKAGKYNMVTYGNAQADWAAQAEKAEAYLVSTQDPTQVSYKDDEGHTDDIAGVSIHVSGFFDLAAKALAAGPVGRGPLADGAYFAIDDEYANDWKEYVSLTVLNGRIAAVNWSGVNLSNEDKKAYDMAGNYKMVEFGNAQAPWYEQAEKAEAYLIANQDFSDVSYKDEEGHTDDIAGVSIHVSGLDRLAEKALAAGPVSIGPYTDGTYAASADEFENGWKEQVSLFVSNGNIVSVNWTAVNPDGEDKKQASATGEYGMYENGGASAPWYEQAEKAEAYLLSTQDPTKITYKDDAGHTDDIAGASVHVSSFFELVSQALAAGVVQN
jgi:major membrane immunogen (membrane-anchored lipoprotein)